MAFAIGDKGGTYQTIGSVRYSGCIGKASPPFDELAHGRLLRCRDPFIRYAFSACSFDNVKVERIEKNAALRFVEIGVVLGARKLFYLVGIVEDDPYIANASRA